MLRPVLAALALLALTLNAAARSTDAPADEYFGPFKYSAISVRSKITSLGRSFRERWSDDASIVHDAGLVETSLYAWAQKYPKDVWLAPTAFHLAQLYAEVQTNEARSHARTMFAYVAKTYPNSKEAHLARLRLQQGFPALHAESPVAPTPNPYARASASPDATASVVPVPSPLPSAPSSAAPSAAPAAASASPVPKPPR